MWLQRFARRPRRVVARPAGTPAPAGGVAHSVALLVRGIALCVVIQAVHGYALVTRVRVELVPAAAAPAASTGPGLCATGVVKW